MMLLSARVTWGYQNGIKGAIVRPLGQLKMKGKEHDPAQSTDLAAQMVVNRKLLSLCILYLSSHHS
jgi:hypothetical protein